MAVYTHVSAESLTGFLEGFDCGALRSFKGIAEGVENSNFMVETDRQRFILTLYEKRVHAEDLPFFLGLMGHLATRGLPCPRPIPARDGGVLHQLAGRPACLIEFLNGVSVDAPREHHAHEVGAALARLHRAAADFALHRANNLSLAGWQGLAADIGAGADMIAPGLGGTIASALANLARTWPTGLPTGAIHADLFPDNVLFLGDRLSGLIDFYFAATDLLAYDLAITLNAWCFSADGRHWHADLAAAMVAGYARNRPLEPQECQALPVLAQGAALRFLLTRAYDWLHTPPDALVNRKDPLAFARRLAFFQQAGAAIAGLPTP